MDLRPHDVTERLTQALGGTAIRPLEPRYLEEPRGRWQGRAGVVVAPSRTEEVARIVRIAAETRTPIVPYSGGTGLVGGQLTETGAPIIVSMERMTRIREVHTDENVIVADAGCTLAAVQDAARTIGRLFPLSYGSEGTARIGGAMSVNSGGLNVLRYGMARDLCLGLEAVLPDGSIFHGLKRLRKDNTGYDLRHLLIGAEGTLGIITGASLRLVPLPTETGTAMLSVSGPEAALSLYHFVQDRVGDGVSAFEILSGVGFDFLAEAGLPHKPVFAARPDWAVLMELGLFGGRDPALLLEEIFAEAFEAGLVMDGVVASSGQQRADLWAIRETIPLANRSIGAIASHDVSLPLSEVAGFLADAPVALAKVAETRINAFGHLGDGNIHFNLFPPKGQSREDFDTVREALSHIVHDMVAARGGSFSAEHGIGRLKVATLQTYGDPARLAAMRAIKDALDPKGIMNPGAVLPEG
ncbi:MAG: FAD-binding oxidoreductase [Pseudomonadota bacterium]